MSDNSYTSLFSCVFPFFKDLCDEDKSVLVASAQSVHLGRAENIHDGSRCTGVIIVKTGSLRVYMLSEEGKEITLYRLFKDDICILSASCALNSITFDVFVDAEEDTDCVIVGGCAFADVCERVPEAKIFTLECALSNFSDVMWVMEQVLFMSMDKRLAIFLLDESAKAGTDTVRLTHEQIAKYMGSAREVVSRMVKYFVTEGIVESSRGGIRILDKKRLRALSQ